MKEFKHFMLIEPKDIEKAVDNMEEAGELVARWLEKKNYEGMGKQDHDEFKRDLALAMIAARAGGRLAEDQGGLIVMAEGTRGLKMIRAKLEFLRYRRKYRRRHREEEKK